MAGGIGKWVKGAEFGTGVAGIGMVSSVRRKRDGLRRMNRGGKKRRGHQILTGVLGTEAEGVPCSYGEKTGPC